MDEYGTSGLVRRFSELRSVPSYFDANLQVPTSTPNTEIFYVASSEGFRPGWLFLAWFERRDSFSTDRNSKALPERNMPRRVVFFLLA